MDGVAIGVVAHQLAYSRSQHHGLLLGCGSAFALGYSRSSRSGSGGSGSCSSLLALLLGILDNDAIDIDEFLGLFLAVDFVIDLGGLGFPALLLHTEGGKPPFHPRRSSRGGRGEFTPPQKSDLVAIVEGEGEKLVVEGEFSLVLGLENFVDELAFVGIPVGRLNLLD